MITCHCLGAGGAEGEEGEAGFPFELAVHADQLQPEMLKVSAPEQTAEGEAAAPPPPASNGSACNGGKAAHKSMLGLVLTARRQSRGLAPAHAQTKLGPQTATENSRCLLMEKKNSLLSCRTAPLLTGRHAAPKQQSEQKRFSVTKLILGARYTQSRRTPCQTHLDAFSD